MLGGCKKSEDEASTTSADAGPRPITAKEYFAKSVYPVMVSACGNANCHGDGGVGSNFVRGTVEGTYLAMEAQIGYIAAPGRSPLVNYVHKDKTVGVFTSQQRNTVTQWLSLEAIERNLEGAVNKPPTLAAAYKAFTDCSRIDVWRRSGMENLPYVQTDKEGPCLGCHSTGQGGVFLPAGRLAFEKSVQFPFVQKFVVGTVDGEGRFDKLVPAGRIEEKSREVCPDPAGVHCHPTFGLPPQAKLAVDTFVQTTLENLRAGTCDNVSGTVGLDAGIADGGPDAR